jgi:hypothetical protein
VLMSDTEGDTIATLNAQASATLVVGAVGASVNGLNTTSAGIAIMTGYFGGVANSVTTSFGGATVTVGQVPGKTSYVATGMLFTECLLDQFSNGAASAAIFRNGSLVATQSATGGWYTAIDENGAEIQVSNSSSFAMTNFYAPPGTIITTQNISSVGGAVQDGTSMPSYSTMEFVTVTAY